LPRATRARRKSSEEPHHVEMTGQQLVPLSQVLTWKALNDTDVLKACIPGCESMEQLADERYQLSMLAKVGPVSARFKGLMTVKDVDEPRAYTIVFEGQGGVAGFAKGQAVMALAPEGESATRLTYTVKAMVGGKLAQLGARLIDGVARKLATEFFTRFNKRMGGDGQSAVTATAATEVEGNADTDGRP
jgi:carbon monoxide dehydrogenase subunit G